MTNAIERYRRILKLMPSADVISFEDCCCGSKGDPSPWFHQPTCPVCIEFWQHQAAASEAVDDAMADELVAEPSFGGVCDLSWLASGD